jgi:hypothetical protein
MSAYLPGESPKPVGILLIDTTGELHVRTRSDWSSFPDEDEIEIWRALAEDLMEKGREFGAESVLAWLENTASHAIQIGSRETIELSNVDTTLKDLYQKHVARSPRADDVNNDPGQKRHFVHFAVAAVLVVAAILVGKLTHTVVLSSRISSGILYPSDGLTFPSESPYRIPQIDSALQFSSAAHHHRRIRHTVLPAHRRLQIESLVLKPLLYKSVEVDSPPAYEVAEMNLPEPPYFDMPEAPSFRVRHNRFVQFLSVIASPFRKLFSARRDIDETVLN